jgi:hypothetical protein
MTRSLSDARSSQPDDSEDKQGEDYDEVVYGLCLNHRLDQPVNLPGRRRRAQKKKPESFLSGFLRSV